MIKVDEIDDRIIQVLRGTDLYNTFMESVREKNGVAVRVVLEFTEEALVANNGDPAQTSAWLNQLYQDATNKLPKSAPEPDP